MDLSPLIFVTFQKTNQNIQRIFGTFRHISCCGTYCFLNIILKVSEIYCLILNFYETYQTYQTKNSKYVYPETYENETQNHLFKYIKMRKNRHIKKCFPTKFQ